MTTLASKTASLGGLASSVDRPLWSEAAVGTAVGAAGSEAGTDGGGEAKVREELEAGAA